jgi:hypothetical protein
LFSTQWQPFFSATHSLSFLSPLNNKHTLHELQGHGVVTQRETSSEDFDDNEILSTSDEEDFGPFFWNTPVFRLRENVTLKKLNVL